MSKEGVYVPCKHNLQKRLYGSNSNYQGLPSGHGAEFSNSILVSVAYNQMRKWNLTLSLTYQANNVFLHVFIKEILSLVMGYHRSCVS